MSPDIKLAGTVVVVEDDLSVRENTTRLLNDRGYQVYAHFHPATILQEVTKAPPEEYALILTDHQLGDAEMTGLDLASRLRQNGWNKPIILATATLLSGEEEKLRRDLGVVLMDTPFGIDNFDKIVDEIIVPKTRRAGRSNHNPR